MSSIIKTDETGDGLSMLATHFATLKVTDKRSHHQADEQDSTANGTIALDEQPDLSLAPPNTQDPGFYDGEALDTSDQMFYFQSNLVLHEETHARKLIFKRGLLRKIKHERRVVLRASRTSGFHRTVSQLTHQLTDGRTFNVWKDDLEEQDEINWVDAWYMPRVEFDPEFQRQFGEHTYQLPLLRRYNDDIYSEGTHLPVPYVFDPYERILPHDSHSMTEYVNKVKRSKSLWEGSKSRLLLKETLIGAAAISVPITRIMCFGLGELQLNGELPRSVF
jgi:hypothetical protein